MRIVHGMNIRVAGRVEVEKRKPVYPSTLRSTDRVVGEQIRLIHRGLWFDVSHIYVTVNGVPSILRGAPTRVRKHGWQRILSGELRKKGVRVENLFNQVTVGYK